MRIWWVVVIVNRLIKMGFCETRRVNNADNVDSKILCDICFTVAINLILPNYSWMEYCYSGHYRWICACCERSQSAPRICKWGEWKKIIQNCTISFMSAGGFPPHPPQCVL